MSSIAQLPLSGDVVQAWQMWLKSLSQQSGLININQTVSGNPELEQKITEDVAGYGKQLGILIDMVELLAIEFDDGNLNETQQRRLKQFKKLAQQIHQAKWEHDKTKLNTHIVDKLMDDLNTMKTDNPEGYQTISKHLQEKLQESGSS